jgi:hypothetical protein
LNVFNAQFAFTLQFARMKKLLSPTANRHGVPARDLVGAFVPERDGREQKNGAAGTFDDLVREPLLETSRLMFLRPELVIPADAQLQPRTTNNPREFFERARVSDWPGYLSSPRVAT